MVLCDIYPFWERQKCRQPQIFINENERKNKQTNDTRKIWQQFDYFRRRFLSKSPALYYCYMPGRVCMLVRVWCMCPLRNVSVLFFFIFNRMVSDGSELLHSLGAHTKRFKCGQIHTESCFCLFIYINIFLRSVLYDDSLSLFRLFTHLVRSKNRKKTSNQNKTKEIYINHCAIFLLHFYEFSRSFRRVILFCAKQIKIQLNNGYKKSHKDMTT